MTQSLPERIVEAWNTKMMPAVLTTVDKNGEPNSIYCAFGTLLEGGQFAFVDLYFDKTKANIDAGSRGSLLIFKDGKTSYQLKGSFEYMDEGEVFEQLVKTVPPNFQARGAVLLTVDKIYCGADEV